MASRQTKTEMGVPEKEGFFKRCGRLLVGVTVSLALSGVYGSSDVRVSLMIAAVWVGLVGGSVGG